MALQPSKPQYDDPPLPPRNLFEIVRDGMRAHLVDF